MTCSKSLMWMTLSNLELSSRLCVSFMLDCETGKATRIEVEHKYTSYTSGFTPSCGARNYMRHVPSTTQAPVPAPAVPAPVVDPYATCGSGNGMHHPTKRSMMSVDKQSRILDLVTCQKILPDILQYVQPSQCCSVTMLRTKAVLLTKQIKHA